VGEGEVILVTTSLDAKWGNWPAKGSSFVPFVQMTLAHLTGKSIRGANRVAGEPLTWTPPDAQKPFDVIRPDGRKTRLVSATTTVKAALSTQDTVHAGVYRFASADESAVSPPFAVVPDLRESDALDALAEADFADKLGFTPVLLNAGTGAESQIAGERSRREWTIWVLAALFALAAVECFWAWRCGKAW
jgi:hypothetical protein